MLKKVSALAFCTILVFGLTIEPTQANQTTNTPNATKQSKQQNSSAIRGNRNSKIYHLPRDCPSYSKIAPHNIVIFNSEAEAQAAGYRKARNCR